MNNMEYCPTEKEMEIVRQRVIEIEEDDKNERKEKEEKKEENEDEGENVYKIEDKKSNDEKDEENDNEEEKENEEDENKNIKKGGKKIIKKRTDIDDEDFNDLKKGNDEIDEIDEIAEEASVHNEKKSIIDEKEKEEEEKERILNEKIRKIQEINLKVNEYYGGSYYGLPSTYVYYSIAHQLHKENTNYLWYLIISVTDEFLRYHISDKKYDEIYGICQSEVLRIEKKKSRDDDTLKIYKSTAKEGKSILIGSDYKLILYRHWNLYDSFIYSSYPLGILSTWK